MAFEARDGKKFSMASRMRAHNVHSDAKAGQDKAPSAILDAPGEEPDGDEQEQDPHAVAAEHGPAQEVQVMHPQDGQEGESEVSSTHPDGHQHHSRHGSKEEAHEHGKCLAGACEHGNEQPEEMGGEESEEEY